MSNLINIQRIETYKQTLKSIALNFNIHTSRIEYLIKLIEKHGYSVLRNRKNRYCSKEFKF